MGSPIESWTDAGAYFTGAGGSAYFILILAIAACVGAIVYGTMLEESAHKKHK